MLYDYHKTLGHFWSPDDLFDVYGSFSRDDVCLSAGETDATAAFGKVTATSRFEEDESGVTVRTGRITNNGDTPATLTAAKSRFVLDGGEWEVYTQENRWQHESSGGWEPLITGVSVECRTNRSGDGMAPMLALWNREAGKGIVFHLLPNGAYELTARFGGYVNEKRDLVVEIGICDHGFCRAVAPGESVELPEIRYYEFAEKRDMDAYRLHRYLNKALGGHKLPVVYNSWLTFYDNLDFDKFVAQAEAAGKLGAEYFTVDAGWFGDDEGWVKSRGDYTERTVGGFGGRMKALADIVRQNGMGFGLWFEIETADGGSKIAARHPEYFIDGENKMMNFAVPAVVDHCFAVIADAVKKYGIAWLKLDFNQAIGPDLSGDSYLKWVSGYCELIDRIRAAFPNIYLENCASGGKRMNMQWDSRFDGYWPSDNESPYEEVRMLKESLVRMAPQRMERYACVMSQHLTMPNEGDCLLACCDAGWTRIESVAWDYLAAFLYGGALGISCDLTALAPHDFEKLAACVKAHKAERAFLQTAEVRVLADSRYVTVLEYADPALDRAVLVCYYHDAPQNTVQVHPVLNPAATYRVGEKTVTGEALMHEGFTLTPPSGRHGEIVTLEQA